MNLKKILTFCFVLSVILAWGVSAQTIAPDNWDEPEYSEVMYYDFDLDIKNEGGNVYFAWNKFEKDEKIKWWKLVFSQTTDDISYPENDARYLWEENSLHEAKQWFKEGDYYFRLCAVSYDNNRYCSKVEKYSVSSQTICTMEYAPVCGKKDGTYKVYSNNCMREASGAYKVDMKYCESNETEPKACTREYMPVCGYKNGKYYTYSNKCMLEAENATYKYSWKCEQSSTNELSEEVQKKVRTRLEEFMENLEQKGYSDEKIVDTIDLLIEKLEVIGKQPKYTQLVAYIIDVLEDLRADYEDDLDILDDLLNGF